MNGSKQKTCFPDSGPGPITANGKRESSSAGRIESFKKEKNTVERHDGFSQISFVSLCGFHLLFFFFIIAVCVCVLFHICI
jgi:hypothetical protein